MERLASLAAEGDGAALERLLALIRPKLLSDCGRILPNRDDAEEACQDAMSAVARHVTTFQGRSKFSTWLTTVAANSARDTYRRLKRAAPPVESVDPELQADPRRTSVIAGTRIDVLDALEQIDHRYAQAVILRDLCGLDYAEIAVELGIPLGTVRSRISEGRRLLRPRLGR